jgi:hypothetical protein
MQFFNSGLALLSFVLISSAAHAQSAGPSWSQTVRCENGNLVVDTAAKYDPSTLKYITMFQMVIRDQRAVAAISQYYNAHATGIQSNLVNQKSEIVTNVSATSSYEGNNKSVFMSNSLNQTNGYGLTSYQLKGTLNGSGTFTVSLMGSGNWGTTEELNWKFYDCSTLL